ncbi:hypothetical protein [Pajaroellobacter abortibovis]|uniref:Uncharacterized protein n=1 Tax=Pajaroellobacter abortibovis TaxID=1882918 RepID=A0A1L6MWD7_9BACT|nr:hypothetical protein [Pajaroellobacter abortibovis]APR99836.1 hypothetical protein BCY86_03450 [Pajaroellobacter abortibovis]
MEKSRSGVLKESRNRGIAAGAAATATLVAGLTLGAYVAIVPAIPTVILGWKWWKHRLENGIRF